jgi:hypothetical protein
MNPTLPLQTFLDRYSISIQRNRSKYPTEDLLPTSSPELYRQYAVIHTSLIRHLTPTQLKLHTNIRIFLKKNHHLISRYREMFPTEDLTTSSSTELYHQYKIVVIQARKSYKDVINEDETDTLESDISYD